MGKKSQFGLEISISILLLFLINGCGEFGGEEERDSIKGTDGITINFLDNNPQDRFLVSDEDELISIVLELRNKGSFPNDEDLNTLSQGQVYISGFDENIINMEERSERLNRQFLTGISSINPEGGFDTIELKGFISTADIVIDKYEPTILATLCYPYQTKASPTVCIDPFPFDDKQKKVCLIGSQTLSSQGAPVAITRIDQEASRKKMQFKINLKNVGGGDIIKTTALNSCNPFEIDSLKRDDFDRIELIRATVGFTELRCGPFAEGNRIIRLHDGEGFILCSLDVASYDDTTAAYTTPLNLEFRYGYRTTVSKPIIISKITSVS